jgi:nitrous oxidase accessory protein NosD
MILNGGARSDGAIALVNNVIDSKIEGNNIRGNWNGIYLSGVLSGVEMNNNRVCGNENDLWCNPSASISGGGNIIGQVIQCQNVVYDPC